MNGSWDGGAGGSADCVGTPPPNQWCALTTPAVTFDYGTVTLADASGAKQDKDIGVTCTTGMKYTLRLRGENDVSLSNCMRAELRANGKPLTSELNGSEGANTVNMTATLTGTPDWVGEFHGESVLFVSYP
ncbi:hypothetical protein ACOQH0_23185 (plasmid) [Enterobacter sp. JS8-1]|uniref:hypothetical protein n=1 Tax=Enterobacter sp. JS8-1 TaxID=3411633 RepID=UPI003BA251EB